MQQYSSYGSLIFLLLDCPKQFRLGVAQQMGSGRAAMHGKIKPDSVHTKSVEVCSRSGVCAGRNIFLAPYRLDFLL